MTQCDLRCRAAGSVADSGRSDGHPFRGVDRRASGPRALLRTKLDLGRWFGAVSAHAVVSGEASGGSNLAFLLPAALFVRLLTVFVLYGTAERYVFCNHPASFVRSEAGQLLRFGGWVTVTSLVSPMMIILDRFIIGALLGAKAVSYYTVPFQLADRTGIIPFALSSALFPRFVGDAPRGRAEPCQQIVCERWCL